MTIMENEMYNNKSLSEAIRERLFSEPNEEDISMRQQSHLDGAHRYNEWANLDLRHHNEHDHGATQTLSSLTTTAA